MTGRSPSTGALEGVVVGTVDVGEASRVVRLLTPSQGRLPVMARGARSSRRRFAGLLEPGVALRLTLVRSRGSLPSLGEVEALQSPRRARADIDRIALLAYGCELCAALAPEGEEAPRLYRLLRTWLTLLEDERPPGLASRLALEAKALTFAGLAPALARCARCGEDLHDPVVFDPESGGALHARCGGGARCRVHELLALEALRRTPLAETPDAKAPLLAWLLSDFARHHLGHDLRSRPLLEQLGGLGAPGHNG